MAKVRSRILSPTGIVVAVVLVAAIVVWLLIAGLQPFSPGALSAAKGQTRGGVTTHAELSKQCGACHTAPWSSQTMNDKCIACHTEIARELKTNGVHVGFMQTDSQCAGCHPDHKGPNASVTKVDHNLFRFKLTGAHADVPCSSCHKGARTMADFKNAPTDCYSCHANRDVHHGSFGKGCGSCHNTTDWGNANFDHSVFPLEHGTDQEKSTCQTCHPRGTSTYTCYGCHRHTLTNVAAEHETRNVARLANCIRCHPQGRGGGD